MNDKIHHVFIIGSKGIPAKYGGFESFVEKLTEGQHDSNIKYYVACMNNESDSHEKEFIHNNALCFKIKPLNIGPAKAVFYDMHAFRYCIEYIKANNIKNPIVYVLACRIGFCIGAYKKKLKELGGLLYVNPDGHEWMRAKWSYLVKIYWKLSEQLMVKHSDLLICDSKNIEKYILNVYKKYNPQTIFIAYGADINKSKLDDKNSLFIEWLKEHNLNLNNYYLIVGRFVPENNYETMIQQFMKSSTKKDLVIITNAMHNKYYKKLKTSTGFDQDTRIKFVGTVYHSELLKKIREKAYGYLHGHEVGGTNPSLLEALGSTKINLLLDVGFNKEVGGDSALYWTKEDLADIINTVEYMDEEARITYGNKAKKRIQQYYSWQYIIEQYEEIFLNIDMEIKYDYHTNTL